MILATSRLALRRTLAPLTAALILASCASVHTVPGLVPDSTSKAALLDRPLSGRLSLRSGGADNRSGRDPVRGFSANFELTGTPDAGQLKLTSPMGNIVALASWHHDYAELRTESEQKTFANTDDLARAALGESLPMTAVMRWLHGVPVEGLEVQPLQPPAVGFRQLGWTVDLTSYGTGSIRIERDLPTAVRLRVRLDPQR